MAGFGGFGGANMQQLMKQAQKMQEEMQKNKEELEASEVTGNAGGGMVSVKINGRREVLEVKINPEAVSPDDVEMLEDLVMAAVNDANSQVDELAERLGPKIPGGMGFQLGMKNFVEPIERLINEFSHLPGVGSKTAGRYAYAVINMTEQAARDFAKAITDAKSKVKYCSVCGNFTDAETCSVCLTRKHDIICVVSEPRDVLALEKVRDFTGTYHVLHGVLSPLDGKGPDDIRIKELLTRVAGGAVSEIILATGTNVEGEATAMYLLKLLKPLGVKVSRIAQGVSLGTELEYADEVTLTRALADRREL